MGTYLDRIHTHGKAAPEKEYELNSKQQRPILGVLRGLVLIGILLYCNEILSTKRDHLWILIHYKKQIFSSGQLESEAFSFPGGSMLVTVVN